MARTPAAKAPVAPGATNYPTIKGPKPIKAVEDYVAKKAQIAALEAELEATKTYILGEMAGAPGAFFGARFVSVSEVRELPALPERVITKEMVGQTIPAKRGRAAYQQIRIQ